MLQGRRKRGCNQESNRQQHLSNKHYSYIICTAVFVTVVLILSYIFSFSKILLLPNTCTSMSEDDTLLHKILPAKLVKGGYLMIKGNPCWITEITAKVCAFVQQSCVCLVSYSPSSHSPVVPSVIGGVFVATHAAIQGWY